MINLPVHMERNSGSFCASLLLVIVSVHMPLPIQSKLPLKPQPDTGQTASPIAGCILGGKSYKLEEKWSLEMEEADMKYCVKCTCFPVTKVRMGRTYLSGKVSCRNIRKCPRQTCESPGGLCCSTCRILVISNEPFWKHDKAEFTALLVGSTISKPVHTNNVAIADIRVYDSTLYYSIRHTRLKQLEKLLFVLDQGNIIHQIHITAPLQSKVCWGKCTSLPQVCGVWRKVPVLYQQYLWDKRVSIVLTTAPHPDGEVKGRVITTNDKHKETFTTVLWSQSMKGEGGRANFFIDPIGYTIYYNITLARPFTGINKLALNQERITVSVLYNRKTIFMDWVYEADGIINGLWMKLKKRTLRQLTRGKLVIKVNTQTTKPFSGRILPRITCGAFQAVLSSSEVTPGKRFVPGIGTAIFHLRQNGKLDYKIGVNGMTRRVQHISLERGTGSSGSGSGTRTRHRKRKRSDRNLMKHFQLTHYDGFDGWANGTYRKPKLKDIHLLLDEKLFIKVSTNRRRNSALRGHIIETPYHERSHLFTGFPFVIRARDNGIFKSSGAAYAWLALDSGCQFHYQILLDDMAVSQDHKASAYLAKYGSHVNSPLNPGFTRMIGKFHSSIISGSITTLSDDLLKALDVGNATLRILTGKHPMGILEASVSTPNNCWKLTPDVSGIDTFLVGVTDHDFQKRTQCQFENRFYEDGETWAPKDVNSCKTCGCERGQVRCQWVLCPQLSCNNPVHIEGQCCPVCPALEQRVRMSIKQNITCFFEADQRWHPAWTVWYPFLHPFGYSTCALCSCLIGKNAWNCTPRTCPPLSCTATVNKFNMSHCCPECLNTNKPTDASDTALVLNDKNMDGACNFQGKVYQNGTEWFSNVMLLGEPHCGSCICMEGKPKCRWNKCPKLRCRAKVRNKNSCCYRCQRKRKKSDNKTGRRKH
ncbi:chordin-like isoform X1 [Octopus vulgaris]|uniref:Chordin-like isoform X1 n=1 Tax=Octopus vulgaris TaxID=6645 RepID=A0AA36FAQ8_OCTVU|nr:chordin-like isoform X1 [Octopus vulgaris]